MLRGLKALKTLKWAPTVELPQTQISIHFPPIICSTGVNLPMHADVKSLQHSSIETQSLAMPRAALSRHVHLGANSIDYFVPEGLRTIAMSMSVRRSVCLSA